MRVKSRALDRLDGHFLHFHQFCEPSIRFNQDTIIILSINIFPASKDYYSICMEGYLGSHHKTGEKAKKKKKKKKIIIQ